MTRIEELMTTNIASISQNSNVQEAVEQMNANHVGAILVKGARGFVGMVTETDIVRKLSSLGVEFMDASVYTVMTTPLASVERDCSPSRVSDYMADQQVRHLAVKARGKIIGLLSIQDLLAHFKQVSESIDHGYDGSQDEPKLMID